MKRLSQEIVKRTYTMGLEFDYVEELKEQEQEDWRDMWMFNDIICAIGIQHNVEV